MYALEMIWPLSFSMEKKSVASLVIKIIIYLVVGAVFGCLIGFLAGIWLIGIIFSVVGSLAELYILIGIIRSVLFYAGAVR